MKYILVLSYYVIILSIIHQVKQECILLIYLECVCVCVCVREREREREGISSEKGVCEEKRLRSTNWQLKTGHGDIKYIIGNIANNPVITMYGASC